MITVRDAYGFLDGWAPFATQESWDNAGLLVDGGAPVERILVALDITAEVVEEALETGAQLLVSHHPVIFRPLRRLDPRDPAYLLARHGLSAICAHTNLDLARGGVNDALVGQLGLRDVEPLCAPDARGLSLGRVGNLPEPARRESFLGFLKRTLGCTGLRYTPGPEVIRRVAVCGGAGADLLPDAARMGADVLVTGESKHNLLLDARALGVMLADAGHYCTERVVLEPLAEALRARFPGVGAAVSRREQDPARFC